MHRMSVLWSRRPVIIAAATVAVLALVGTGTAVALTAPPSAHMVSLASAGHSQAALKIVASTPLLEVSIARLPGTLMQVSTPDDAPVIPVLSGTAPIVLSLAGAGSPKSGKAYAVSVVLSSAVKWSLDFAGGTQRTRADLRGGRINAIAVTAGSDILQVSLPKPTGTLHFLLAGGVTGFQLSLPGGVPVRVGVGGGASSVSVDNRHLTGVAGGTVLTSPGWSSAKSRFDLDATAGFSRLTVSRWAAPRKSG